MGKFFTFVGIYDKNDSTCLHVFVLVLGATKIATKENYLNSTSYMRLAADFFTDMNKI